MRRLPTLVIAVLSVMATTVVLAPLPATAVSTLPAAASVGVTSRPVGPAAASGCPKVIFIGARGSGESDERKFAGMGQEVFNLFAAISPALGGQVRSLPVIYQAKAVDTLYLSRTEKRILAAGAVAGGAAGLSTAFAGIALAYNQNHLGPFVSSIDEGITSAREELTTMATQCPEARFVLAGYSQGAMVMHQMILQLNDGNSPLLDRVFATVLIADGDKKRETAAIRFGTSSFEAEGVRSKLEFGERDVATPSTTYDICNAGDYVCDFTLQTLLDQKKATNIHENSYKSSRLVKNIGKSIAADLLAAPVESLVVATTSLPAGTLGVGYSTVLSATGGQAPLTWSVASGSLPPGLSLSTAGSLSGTPTTAGSVGFTVAVHDSTGATATAPLTLLVGGPGAIRASSISAGNGHTCAVTTAGAVKCWGSNGFSELGDGTTTNSTTPVDVVGLGSGVASISAGGLHTCAVTTAGAVKCWGYNFSGQLGDGTTASSTTPVDVVGLGSGVASVSAGNEHTCAVTTAGAVKCWGSNPYGELGDGTTASSTTPVDVVGLGSGVASVSAGGAHSCAVTTAGAVKCWGNNGNGELGDGTITSSTTPVDVVGLGSGVASISAGGAHSCAVTIAGAVKCWGWNGDGELGNGTTSASSTTPVDVVGLGSGVASISTLWNHTCAVTTSGAVKCWGSNPYGELGDGTTTSSTTPVDVVGLGSGVAAVSAGGYRTCAVTTNGAAKCWGNNNDGELGDGTTTNSATPVDVIGLP